MKAIIVPIDNRPVTYVFPQIIGRLAGIETVAPPRDIMGSLTAGTSVEHLNAWLEHAIQRLNPEVLLVCIDSVIYGGLIPSRRIDVSASEILQRAKVISRWKRISQNAPGIFAQSSIMRISDNYDNTEEKTYWSEAGREIFAWSEALHKLSSKKQPHGQSAPDEAELKRLESLIKEEIRKDYLETRWRNFQLNRKLIDYAQSGDIDFLVFSQDDSGQFGLNVMEKERLLDEAKRRALKNVIAYSGADEVLMTMIGRWLLSRSGRIPATKVSFSANNGPSVPSRYEGQSIGESVIAQLDAIGLTNTDGQPEFHIIIHSGEEQQGDHIWLPGHPDQRSINTDASVRRTLELLETSDIPCVLCDVSYANGSDPALIEQLLQRPELLKKLWGYAGWNTTGNTLGSALATGVARWFAETSGSGERSRQHLQAALFVRLADDWAYQTQARKQLGQDLSEENLQTLMGPHLERIANALGQSFGQVSLSLPWQRSFEVEIALSEPLNSARGTQW